MIDGIGINVPQDVAGAGYVEHLAGFAEAAVAYGYDSLWVSESLKPDVVDPLAALNFLAARTSDVRLGVAVLIAGLRSPLRLAREVASLDQLSAGRAIVGVGVGNDRAEYARHGIEPGHRGRHFEGGIRLLQELLTQDVVSEQNRWRLEDEPRPLRPFQQPAPPIWFGARAGEALRRAVRMGDGWVGAGSMSQVDFMRALAEVREALDGYDRDPGAFSIAKRVYLHVTQPPVPAEAVNRWFSHHYGNSRRMEEVFVMGSVDHCVQHLGELRAAGVKTLILHPVVEVRDQMEMLATEVIPQLAGLT